MATDSVSASRYLPLIGRVLLSIIFLVGGFNKIMDWDGTLAYIESTGLPIPSFFLILAIVIELAGGLSLLLGWNVRYGAALLFLYVVPVTLIFHDFWTLTGAERQMQLTNFLKNLAILGGLAEVAAFGPGPVGVLSRPRAERIGVEDRLHTPA